MLGLGAAAAQIAPANAQNSAVALSDFIPSGSAPDDYTEIFAKAMGEVARRKSGELWVPPGRYPLRKLTLRSEVVVRGSGKNATVLLPTSSNEDAFITLDIGPVIHAGLKGLGIVGGTREKSTNGGQWAIRFTSAPARQGKAHGGLWWSSFEDIRISNFDRGIWFEGGTDSYLLPHQYVSLRDIGMYGWRRSAGPALRMSGQVNQFSLTQVHLNGWRGIGAEIVKSDSGKTSPKLHHFDVVTIEETDQAAIVDGAHNVQFSNCWFEKDSGGILVRKGSIGISVMGSRFANVGKNGPAVRFEAGATGSITGNVFAGPETRQAVDAKPEADLEVARNSIIWGARE